ncbi:hypothetical protein TIFTF001_020444 [Ficus carica]|uniref:Transposase n=1 Tax=Ficus carica TaxID=3494 RepID=A0AA88A8L6_FICCA|nr:hypothetical protein TIFTF001_020444 [Ficus carica]
MSQDHEDELSTQSQIEKPRRTNSPRFNPDEDGKRRATLMRRVHLVRTKGERIEVSFDAKGQPLGKEEDELQSWIGVLAREHIPIWIADFRKTVWQRPPKVVHNYPTFSQDDWERFIAYRRTSEFKRLSEQGSEIRKKSKYRSIGGRDGYWKRDQKLTGQWQARHTVWLDMHVKLDGEFKNPSFRIIGNTIEYFSEQETQGSFKYVGTNDILTKSLGNAEHSGRTRGQSKFVKQSQYFNLVQSSRENAEVSDMKRQLAALERIVRELRAEHSIN